MRQRRAWVVLWVWLAWPLAARAEPLDDPDDVGVLQDEAPDATRLSVAHLPVEATPKVRRAQFDRGGYLDAALGARGFVGDLGDVARPGPMLSILGGYELARWVAIGLTVVGSIHTTDHPAPASRSAFEAFEALAHVRLSVPIRAQAALWLRGEGGVFLSTGDVVRARGFSRGDDPVPSAGGALGFDWHLLGRHHSLGLEAGSRVLPGLDTGGVSLSVHGAAYLHYVF